MAEALDVQIRADAASFTKGMNEAIAGLNRLVAQGQKASKATDQISKSTQSLANGMKAFGIGLAAAIGSQVIGSLQQLGAEFVQLAEAPTKFKASLEALTGSSKRAEDMLRRVYDVSKRTGTGFADTASLVQKLTIGLNALGANNAQIAQIAENILKLGTIGGSSIADTAAAAQQLSQALASGKLQGDELRSILERMPTLAQIIAKEMGVSVGELKKLGAEGKITSDIIANSLLKSTQKINEDFAKMPLTVGQAMNNIKTSIQQAFDNPAAKAGVQALAQGINSLAVAIRAADLYIRNFATNARNMFNAIVGAITPAVSAVEKLGVSFSGIGSAISSALSGVANMIKAAFLGPIGLVISNWDQVRAYFENNIPAMFYKMAGAAREGMAAVISIFNAGFQNLVSIAESAINAIVNGLNLVSSKINDVYGALGGAGKIVQDIQPVKLAFGDLTNTIVGMQVAAKDNFAKAGQYAQKYATDLRTIARTQAETNAMFEAGTGSANGMADALKNVSTAADGSGGGGGKGGKGGGGGGAAGGIKKAGDAAKKAAKDMKDAQSQVEEFGQAMQSIAQSLGSGVVDALFSIADGSKSAKEAFTELAKSMLKQIANMIIQLLVLKPLLGMFGGGMGLMGGAGGIMGRSGASLGALSIGSSRSNRAIGDYTGFNLGPAVAQFKSSAISSANQNTASAPMNVTINNNSSASVKTKQDNGQLTIDIIEEVVADRLTRGGNKIDQAMARAYGARRVGY